MSGWEHESRSLFTAARAGLEPPAEARSRVRAKLAAQLGVALVGGAAATGVTSTASASASAAGAGAAKGGVLLLAAKLAAPVVVVGAIASAAVVARRPAPPQVAAPVAPRTEVRAEAPRPAPAPVAVAAPTVAAADLPSALPSPAAPARVAVALAASTPTSTASAPAAVDPSEEAVLVARMDAELRAGRPSSAAKLAAEHERRFPQGLLVEEREGARVLARCATLAEGRSVASGAEAYLAAHPRSPLRGRILAACREP